jgi:4-amino-4-deoxy-L-arabinose transferase-like glycosyltransferase
VAAEGAALPGTTSAATPGPVRLARRLAAPAIASPVTVVGVAAALRLAGIGGGQPDPYYDAAVRSMGTSWHAFLVGAFEPAARVAIDKPPVDLWLQVASTKLLGFTTTALILPAALAGTLAVAALYDLLRVLLGRRAALAGALALAVLPIAVVTARSDTMDAVMGALVLGAAALTARAARSGRVGLVVAAGAVLGLAFEVKLFEALVVVPALVALWGLGVDGGRRRRVGGLVGAGVAFAVVALAWLGATSLALPAHERPFALGSTNGSAWNAVFAYDGIDRLRAPARVRSAPPSAAAVAREPAAPGPLRLLSTRASLQGRVGIALVAAFVALGAAFAAGAWRRLDRLGRAGLAALAVWLACGAGLTSAMGDLHPRYLEALSPAVAAALGAGAVLAARGRARLPLAVAFAAVVAFSLAVSIRAVAADATDSGRPGFIAPARVAALSAFLRAHDGPARDEVATVVPSKAAQLIARDGRPVLVLANVDGRPIAGPAALAAAARAGAVRYALVGDRCAVAGTAACTPVARWIRAHGTDVSASAAQPVRGFLYRLPARTPTRARARTSSRSPAAAPRARRRSSAGRRRSRRARHRARSARHRARRR